MSDISSPITRSETHKIMDAVARDIAKYMHNSQHKQHLLDLLDALKRLSDHDCEIEDFLHRLDITCTWSFADVSRLRCMRNRLLDVDWLHKVETRDELTLIRALLFRVAPRKSQPSVVSYKQAVANRLANARKHDKTYTMAQARRDMSAEWSHKTTQT